jgi:peptide/nickel transport system permease protein
VRNLPLIIPTAIFFALLGACFLGPAIGNLGPPSGGNILHANLGLFAAGHPLGTDQLGNDMLTRCLFGGRASFEIGFSTVSIGFVVGSVFGLIAGFYGGKIELLIMRIVDILLSLPALIIALAVASALGASLRNEIFAISFFTVPGYIRLARAQTLRRRTQDFVIMARVMGGRRLYVALKHVYPNILPSLMTFFPLGVGIAMLVEATLSFLGLGIRPPQPSWGNMIAIGQSYISSNPTLVLIPSLFLLVTITTLNLIGEQIRLRWAK